MPTKMVTLTELTDAVKRASGQLKQRNFSPGGAIYLDFAEPLATFSRYIEQQEALALKPLDHQTLREGSYIWQTVENWGLADQVKKIAQLPSGEDKVRRYRCEIEDLGALEGTSAQIVALLKNVPVKPSPMMKALAYQEIEAPEPTTTPAPTKTDEVMPADPADRYEGRNRAD